MIYFPKLTIVILLTIIDQIYSIYNMSIYQNLTYQFLNPITTINFNQNTNSLYVLTSQQNLMNQSSIMQINKLQINDTYDNYSSYAIFQLIDLTNNQAQFFAQTYKNQSYEEMVEINNDYVLMYTKNQPYYQIFSINGSIYYHHIQQNNSQYINLQFINQTCVIEQILYSKFQQKVYIFYTNGIIQIVQFNQYLLLNDTSEEIVNISFSGKVKAVLSPNQNLLVVYLKESGQISLYKVNSNASQINNTLSPIFQNLTFYQIDLLVWDSKSSNFYVFNELNSSLYQVELFYSISTMKYTYKVWIYSLDLNYSSSNIQSFFATKNSNRLKNGNGNNKQTSVTSNVSYTYLESKVNHKLMYFQETDQIMLVKFTLSELNFTNITTYTNTTQNKTNNGVGKGSLDKNVTNSTGPINATFYSNWLQTYLMVQFLTYDFYDPFFTSRLINDMTKVFLNQSGNISIVQKGQINVQFDSGGYFYVFGWNKKFGELFVDVGGIMFFSNITYSTNTSNITTNYTGGSYTTKTRTRNQATFSIYGSNTTNTTNSTNSTNLTNSTNITNSTNSTTNPTSNQTSTNTTTTNTTTNLTTFIKQKSQAQQNYQGVVDAVMDNSLLNAFNKFPGSRKYLRPIFMFFGNFDDIWLYYYHERNYSQIVDYIFEKIRKLQQQKWQLVNVQNLWQTIVPFDVQVVQNYFNSTSKLKFTSSKYLLVQSKSTGYIENTLNFYCSNLIFILITFLVGKMLFTLAVYFTLKIKTFFHQFKFGYYLLIVSLEGNIQFMSYLFGFEIKSMVKMDGYEIFQLSFVVLHNFLFIFAVMGMYFFIEKNYKHNSLKLYQNFDNLKYTCLYFTVQYGLRNIILGMVHIMLSQQIYITKISILISIQFSFLFFNMYLVHKKKIFTQKTRVWITAFTIFVRIMFISLFLPTFDESMQLFQQGLFIFVIYLYMFLWVVSIINEFAIMVAQIYQFFKLLCQSKQKMKVQVNKQQKNNTLQDSVQQPNKNDLNLQSFQSSMNESLLLNRKMKTNLIKPHINRQSLLANPNMKLKFKNFRKVKKSFNEGNPNNQNTQNQNKNESKNENKNEEQINANGEVNASPDMDNDHSFDISNNDTSLNPGLGSKARVSKLSSFGSNNLKASRFSQINKNNQDYPMSIDPLNIHKTVRQPESKIEQEQQEVSSISSERKNQQLNTEDNLLSPKNSPRIESQELPSEKTYEPTSQQLQAIAHLNNNRKILYRNSANLPRHKDSSIVNRKESFRPRYRQSITHNTEQSQENQNVQPSHSINQNPKRRANGSKYIKIKLKNKKRLSKSMSVMLVKKQDESLLHENNTLANNQSSRVSTILDL